MGMQDWLLIAGGVILVTVIADLIRRYLQRDKLRLKIDKQFQDLPDLDPTCSELPNGGARVVTDPEAQTDWSARPNEPVDDTSQQQPEPRFQPQPEPRFEQQPEPDSPQPLEPTFSETEPTLTADPVRAESEWQIDPILTGERPTAEPEVDLLMEKEFRGVGEGAHRWLDQTEASMARSDSTERVEPVADLEPTSDAEPLVESEIPDEPRSQAVEETLAASDASVVEAPLRNEPQEPESETLEAVVADQSEEPVGSEVEAKTEAKIEDSAEASVAATEPSTEAEPQPQPTMESEAEDTKSEPQLAETPVESEPEQPPATEPSNTQPSLSAVEPTLDLERPVHELLQEQQANKREPQLGDLDALVAESATAEPEPMPEVVEAPPRKPAATRTRKRKRKPRPEEQTSFFDLLPDLAPEPEPVKPKPKTRRRKAKAAEPVVEAAAVVEDTSAQEDEVLVINVDARIQPFAGPILFKLLNACGMEHGAMEIFHRHEQDKGRGAIQFSTANAVAPGTFDPANSEQFSTPAVTFFMRMSEPADRMNAFECMLATAQCVADNLGGELKDENRSSLRTQTIEHYRQKVREFERKQLTRRV
ncbi:cell division protein ZipA [Motiliproteus sp.]|uniref:cell division protein ZipA n=1 Tax=Motiliproteus sp. TaxID=1898955 RepID=UPI003BAD8162